MNIREIGKFFSGFDANQVLTHGAFAVGGLEFTLLGIPYTTKLNSAAAIARAIVLGL